MRPEKYQAKVGYSSKGLGFMIIILNSITQTYEILTLFMIIQNHPFWDLDHRRRIEFK